MTGHAPGINVCSPDDSTAYGSTIFTVAIPEGTLMFKTSDGKETWIRRCEVCAAAIIEAHDADYVEHMEWHERTRTT